MSGRKIIPMEEAHLGAVAALERACFSQPWSENALREELGNPNAVFLVCLEGEDFAGYGGMHTPMGDCYLDNIAVAPDFRGKGVAKDLLAALVERAKALGGTFLSLEVRPSNTQAVGLYLSQGFAREGLRKGFYQSPQEDAWIMTKRF